MSDRTPRVGQAFTVDVRTAFVVAANDWLRPIAVAPGKDWHQVAGTSPATRAGFALPPPAEWMPWVEVRR